MTKLSNKPTSELEIITPELAAKWLRHNENNRHITKNSIEIYTKAMLRGEWEPNTHAIGFDVDGNLMDGQHRLYAIVHSGIAIESFVVRNLPKSAFTTIDIGRNRKAADFLSISGHINATSLAAGLWWLYVYKRDGFREIVSSRRISHSEILETLEHYKLFPESVQYIMKLSVIQPLIRPSASMALYHIFSIKCPKESKDFFKKLYTGSNLNIDSPILALRNQQLHLRMNRVNQSKRELVISVIKSWNAFINNQPMTAIKITHNEDIPEIQWGQQELQLSA